MSGRLLDRLGVYALTYKTTMFLSNAFGALPDHIPSILRRFIFIVFVICRLISFLSNT
jgi:hypothetical protein